MNLSAGQLALVNFSFLICDVELSGEDLLLVHPLLVHLGIDSQTMLEQNHSSLMESDCEAIAHITGKQTSSVCLLLIGRLQQVWGTTPLDLNLSE